MEQITLLSQTGSITIDSALLKHVSSVFRHLVEHNPKMSEWSLCDFSQATIEQFVDFVKRFHHIDVKIPTQVQSHEFSNNIQEQQVVSFMTALSRSQLFELLFFSNFIQYDTLFQLCCLQLECWMTIPAHAAMAQFFDMPLNFPSFDMVQKQTFYVNDCKG